MGDGAEDALRHWVRYGMKQKSYSIAEKCPRCDSPIKTLTSNWTWCENVEDWHGEAAGKKEKYSNGR